ncbi:MAG: hypothetical protein K2Q24_02325 [Chitinophagaceae bacterium]|jgi:hypothetical protein|nr:hypothetical protein [Chitinophagaceae bacterium]
MKQVLLLLSFSVLITSCARKRMMERVQRYNIKTIAILPAQLEVTGNIPKKLTPEQMQQIIIRNTRFLNQALYTDLVQYVDTRLRRYSQVEFQSAERTKKLLSEKGITDSASWQMDPIDLAKILGVDAVVATKVTQQHILDDDVAMGIDVIGGVLNRTIPGIGIPTGTARTSDMFVSSALIREGYTVWSSRFTNQTDWNYPFQQSIQNVTRAIARRFPL